MLRVSPPGTAGRPVWDYDIIGPMPLRGTARNTRSIYTPVYSSPVVPKRKYHNTGTTTGVIQWCVLPSVI